MNIDSAIKKPEPSSEPKFRDETFEAFWYSEIVRSETRWKIDHLKLINFIRSKGYRRFDIGSNYIFVQIIDGVIEETTITHIQDMVIDYINKLFKGPDSDFELAHESGITRNELLSKFYTSPAIFFNDRKLSTLGIEKDLKMNNDTKEDSYIYYLNGFVKCYADGYEHLPYEKLEGHIFKNQIKNRKFEEHTFDGMFKKFVFNITGKDEKRFLSLQTMIGYLLHWLFWN